MDGVDLCHMGDVGEECTVRLAEVIGSVNVLMIPIGGNYTIDAKQAKEYVDINHARRCNPHAFQERGMRNGY